MSEIQTPELVTLQIGNDSIKNYVISKLNDNCNGRSKNYVKQIERQL